MANVFGDYPELKNTDSVVAKQIDEKVDERKKIVKQLKKMIKTIRKQNKLLNQLHEENLSAKRTVNEEVSQNIEMDKEKVVVKKGKSFLEKVGDIFLKTLPSILRTVVPLVVSSVLGKGASVIRKGMKKIYE